MNKGTVAAIAAAALVFGLVVGSIGIASAAPAQTATGTQGTGARLGSVMRQAGATLADVVAKLTGRPVAEVRTERRAGTSFTDIANAKGVSADQVVQGTLDARKSVLDAAVKSGRITQAQADAALANMKARLTTRVGSTAPCGKGAGAGTGGRGNCGGACGGAGVGVPAQ